MINRCESCRINPCLKNVDMPDEWVISLLSLDASRTSTKIWKSTDASLTRTQKCDLRKRSNWLLIGEGKVKKSLPWWSSGHVLIQWKTWDLKWLLLSPLQLIWAFGSLSQAHSSGNFVRSANAENTWTAFPITEQTKKKIGEEERRTENRNENMLCTSRISRRQPEKCELCKKEVSLEKNLHWPSLREFRLNSRFTATNGRGVGYKFDLLFELA